MHTPGPWEVYAQPIANADEAKAELAFQVDNTEPLGAHLYLINANGKCPALTGCGPTSKANARLIAASPDLLQSAKLLESLCQWLLHAYGPNSPAGEEALFRAKQVHAALTKATGAA